MTAKTIAASLMVFLASFFCTAETGLRSGAAAGLTPKQAAMRNCFVIVVNDLPGSHTVSYTGFARRTIDEGGRAVFAFSPAKYVMLNLDGGLGSYYHIYTQPGVYVIYTSWFVFGPL